MKLVPLTKGYFTVVDDCDYDHLMQIPWRYNNNGYAITAQTPNPRAMHHYILQVPPGKVVDHINRDRLDNRRSNLRVCTPEENSKNRSKRRGSLSKYKGVSYSRRDKVWAVKIWVGGKNKHLGVYRCEIQAAMAYDVAAIEHYGEFANINFPNSGPEYAPIESYGTQQQA